MKHKCANCGNRDRNGFCETITEALRLDPKILASGLPTLWMPDNGSCLKFEPSAEALSEELAESRDGQWDNRADGWREAV